MANQIFLNNQPHHFNENNLPCLITYKRGEGGSQFTMTMIADLFLNGSKILILTAYPMAKDNFFEQTKGNESKIAYVESVKELKQHRDKQAIIIKSGNEEMFLQSLEILNDTEDRIILIKNMEVFSESVQKSCKNFKKIIFSGDIDKYVSKKQINNIIFNTTIMFSKPKIKLTFSPPELEKYCGYMWHNGKEGIVKIKLQNSLK